MPSVPITELKANLAKYVRMARRGVEVQVLERGVPVARLVGVYKGVGDEALAVERLVSAGVVRSGSGGMRALLERRIRASADLTGAIAEERTDRA